METSPQQCIAHIIDIFLCTHTASPEEIPSVLQHCINIDELPFLDGDEPAVSRVVVLYRTGYQDWVCVQIRFYIWLGSDDSVRLLCLF